MHLKYSFVNFTLTDGNFLLGDMGISEHASFLLLDAGVTEDMELCVMCLFDHICPLDWEKSTHRLLLYSGGGIRSGCRQDNHSTHSLHPLDRNAAMRLAHPLKLK